MSDRSGIDAVEARRLLEVDDVTTAFPTPSGLLYAVDGVSLTLDVGETIGIVGESGSGKSVLARSIMRLTPPTAVTSGAIRFRGRDVTTLTAREARSLWGRSIAMVFQNPMTSLNPVMRVGRQLTEILQLHFDIDRATARGRAVELLAMVGVPDPERRLRSYPQELSGGMRQRVCIAIAIACSPDLLLADEPTTALDVTIQRQVLDLLASLQQETNMAMVLITHDLGVVAGRTSRVLVMYGGRIVEMGRTADLFTDHHHPYTASLLAAIPRIEDPSHTRLRAIPGRPTAPIDPAPGCRFAARCAWAQEICTAEDPPLVAVPGQPEHRHACFFPIDASAEHCNARADGSAVGVRNRSSI